jgi:DNA-binding HxlR family transcriptional regulator
MIYTNQEETINKIIELNEQCINISADEETLSREIMELVTDKWALWIFNALAVGGQMRFTRVLEQVEGISQKMLTKSLRQLEREGFVKRTMFLEVPPRVEYNLTPAGFTLLDQVMPIWQWVIKNLEFFSSARAAFDKAKNSVS